MPLEPPLAVLAVSPHLDDAVMSVGASLTAAVAAGRRVVVCTVFAGGPHQQPLSEAAKAFHAHCGLGDDAVDVRRAEDEAAVTSLGATPVHLGRLDAIYREAGGCFLYRRPGAAFGDDWPAEPDLLAQVTSELRTLIATLTPATVWTCRGLGGHVDHRLVSSAVATACAEHRTDLLLWRDLPYGMASYRPAADAISGTPGVTQRHLRQKLVAIASYRSQLRAMWQRSGWSEAFIQDAHDTFAATGMYEPMWRSSRTLS